MSLGTNIQYLRKLNKLTQEQFAEKWTLRDKLFQGGKLT